MLSFVKQKFPFVYEYAKHLRRLKAIREIERVKGLDEQSQLDLLGKIYQKNIGHSLDWNNLTTYTEKMQYEKFYNVTRTKADLSDKYLVREWIEEKIGEEYLIPLLGVWSSFDEIDFSKLPDSFVLKTNHGSGSVLIVKDKTKLDMRIARLEFNDWMRTDYGYKNGFEKHYSLIKPLIIAEQYLECEDGELQDYKFLCFDGKPYFCWVDKGRFSHHTRDVFDMDWNLQPWNQAHKGHCPEAIPMPENFELMKNIATTLCEGFKHVRVDLYNVGGKIYFGEMTFTNGGGNDPIVPEEYDKMLGDLWNLEIL